MSVGLSPTAVFLPVFVLYNGVAVLIERPSSAILQWSMIAIGVVAFTIGVIVSKDSNRGRRRARSNTKPAAVRVPHEILYALLAVTVTVFGYLIARSGVPILAADVNLARVSFFPNGYYSTIAVVSASSLLTLSLLVVSTSTQWAARRLEITAAVLVVGLLAGTANRGLLLLPLLVVALYRAWNRRYKVGRLVIAALVGFAAFSYSGYIRNSSAYGPTYDRDLANLGFRGPARFAAPSLLYVAGTSKILDKTIHEFPAHTPHPLGGEFFSPLLFKPSVDLYLKDHFGYTFVGFGVAPGVLTAFYLDWGIAGVVGGFFVGGALAGALHRRARIGGVRMQLSYVSLLASMILSNYGHPFAYLSYLLIPAVTIYAVRERRPRPSSALARRQVASSV